MQKHRQYHAKRSHRKSRNGCYNCKSRKVKCDEVRPTCGLCAYRRLECLYSHSWSFTETAEPPPRTRKENTAASAFWDVVPVLPPNLLLPSGDRQAKLLWFYNNATYTSFSIENCDNTEVEHITRKLLLDLAIKNPFLMSSILALTNIHIESVFRKHGEAQPSRHLEQGQLSHQVALEGFTEDIASALLANSMILLAVSSRVFTQHGCDSLYLGEWMSTWINVRQAVDRLAIPTINVTELAALFRRPDVDLALAEAHIPNALLIMVSSMAEDDIDYPEVFTYYETSQYIGSLYEELRHGCGPVMYLRIITWLTHVSQRFVELVQELRPRALLIAAHYLAFLKLVQTVWWLDNVGKMSLHNVCVLLGSDWTHLLEIPNCVLEAHSVEDITKALLPDV